MVPVMKIRRTALENVDRAFGFGFVEDPEACDSSARVCLLAFGFDFDFEEGYVDPMSYYDPGEEFYCQLTLEVEGREEDSDEL